MKPYNLKGMTWALDTPEVDPERLLYIPGLQVIRNQRVEGYPDAVAVACRRLGIDELPLKIGFDVRTIDHHPKLRPYQVDGITRMTGVMMKMGGVLLADDMGLGKTVQAIMAAKSVAPNSRRFVVCPGAVRETWRDDLTKWGEQSFAILSPQAKLTDRDEWLRAKDAIWVVTSYELASRAFQEAFTDQGQTPAVLIVDEMHMVKGRSRGASRVKRADILQDIAAMTPYKIGLTGTPIWDRPRDFWRILKILFGGAFGNSWDFDHAYCGAKFDEHGGLDNRGATRGDELKLRLSYYQVRREKREVLKDLPPLTRQVIWVDSTAQAKSKFYAFQMKMAGTTIHDAIEATLTGKMEAVFQLCRELKHFVVFTWMRAHARQMAKILSDEGTPCVAITGDMPPHERAHTIRVAAQAGHGVVATIDSVGTGIDVLKLVASTAIIHSIDFVPQKMAQAEARLHRIGQKENVHIIYVAMKDSVDEVLVRTVVNKLDAVISVMGQATQGIRDELAANEGGAGIGEEQAALRAIYEELR